ncbi:SR-related and CTD-associated factor 8 [Callorhinchus milii]|uniref:SR-related and CTD-associated factor 8 n=1 Tax=Callorhinchus milii TaxID=7868 RepID=UPI0004575A93|nr:SR-related and CTD-associated factor 8 [Callorhinchus milii]|eukprot:gi/632974436/ref/XP_007903677.1/ PREDICTED: protein SCAF8 [Callorhinchus milii]
MEAVKAFNNELYSLNEYKPPISRAKMNQVTKAAIKAIKFYKHVVQSVEKFVQKCKPEYKVPGLYVIDSIVRQSRHQFGPEKDVFAPRFCKNINSTFQNLYKCPADDKSKVVRVLNLWQKNSVFKSEVIQPLLDMAAGIPPPSVTPAIASTAATVSSNTPGTPATPATPANVVQNLPDSWASISQMSNTDTIAAVAQLLQSPQGQQLQQLVQSLQMQQQKPQPSLLQALDAGLVVQLQALTAQLTAAATAANTLNPLEQRLNFNKKLLDRFEYDEEHDRSEEVKKETPPSQLPLVTETMNTSLFQQLAEQFQQQNFEQFRQQLMEQQQQTQQNTTLDNQEVTFGSEKSVTPSQGSTQLLLEQEIKMEDSLEQQQQDMDIDAPDGQETIEEEIFEQEEKKPIVRSRSRTRSQSRSRSPRKKRSRSRSGSRKRKHRKRSRSRSKERKRKSSRSYSSERRAKERQRKGLPPVRSKTLSVCSTTLWVGQVDKKATQQDITNLFEEFGQIESINMIPPRGCAYVSMVHRQDAHNTLQELSTGSFKMGSKIIKIAWALNKGVKPEYKQFWDVDLGVTYIPWEKVKLDDLVGFSEGGMIDQETVNSEWKSRKSTSANENVPQTSATDGNTQPTSQAEAFTQPVTMLPVQIPVVPTVSGVGIVQPPTFPLSMSIPPPGFNPAIPPPPFLRPGFNPSQPPPGYLPPPVVPLPAVVPSIPAVQSSLGHPSLSTTQDGAKDSPFGNLLSHIGSGPSSLTSPVIQPGSMFNQVGSQAPPAGLVGSNDLGASRTVNQTSSSETVSTTGPGNQSAASSGPALGMQPSTPGQGPQSLPPPNMPGPRMPGGLPLDMRSGMMPPSPGQRFPLLMPPQPNMPPSLAIDGALQSGPRGSFLPGSPFSRPEGAFVRSGVPSVDSGTNTNQAPGDERRSAGNESSNFQRDSMQQEGDRDYRFPPVEGRDGVGRRDQFGYGHDHRWGSRDFDERERRGMPFGGPKVFHDDHDRYGGRNFRFDGRSGPMWNRGFDQEAHRDFDDRSRPWERQRDRDDRDFAFRRDVNGSRFGRDREQDHWVPPRQRFDYFQGTTEHQKPDDRPRVNGDFSETDSQPPNEEIENNVPELPAKLDSPTDESQEKNDLENPPVTENKDNEET